MLRLADGFRFAFRAGNFYFALAFRDTENVAAVFASEIFVGLSVLPYLLYEAYSAREISFYLLIFIKLEASFVEIFRKASEQRPYHENICDKRTDTHFREVRKKDQYYGQRQQKHIQLVGAVSSVHELIDFLCQFCKPVFHYFSFLCYFYPI